jgi:ArsR family transcriptional regulator
VAEELSPFVRRVIGVDNSPAMLKAAKKRVAGLENVELRSGDLHALPLAAGECDAALLLLALTYVLDPGPVLAEAGRVLKPAGKLVIVDLLPHDRDDFRRQMDQQSMGIGIGEMEKLLAAVGFERIRMRALPPEPTAKGPALFVASGERGAT